VKRLLRAALWTIAAFLFLVMISPYVFAGGLRVIWIAFFGWIEFLKRVVPEVSVNWSGVGMVALCSVLIVGGLHWLCRWFHRHRSAKREETRSWRLGWSLALYFFLWLLFLAAIGITGFTHQVGWLVTSKEPWRAPRKILGVAHYDLQQAAMLFSTAAKEEGWHLARTQQRFFSDEWFVQPRNSKLIERVQAVMMPDAKGNISQAALFFRDPDLRERIGMFVIDPDGPDAPERVPFNKLSELISNAAKSGPSRP
jgi:hypothetical protein